MIFINNLSKTYGKKTLFEGISLNINRGEKIGMVGPNGAGKSTFFHLLLGDAEPSAGTIQTQKGVRIGYLPQESSFHSEHTVLDELTRGDEGILELLKEKEGLERADQAASFRYGEILHELDILGYFELEHKAEKVLMGLGFKERDFNRPITQMSGGWQMRVLLAKLLVLPYDILLLDEPTNYLDLNAALWLKSYLAGYGGTFLMISHDKSFLREVTNETLVLEHGQIAKVTGSYEHYEQLREEQRLTLERRFEQQEKKRKQLDQFIARFHAQPNKAAAVRNKRKTIERMEEIHLPPDMRESIRTFHFPRTRPSGHRVVKLENIAKSYGEIRVYQGLDFEIERGEKAVLAGENGAGKSTLLKILAGVIPFDAGNRQVGHNVDIGYFSQTRLDTLNPENTVLEEAYNAAPGTMSQEALRTILGAFLFSGEDVDKRVSVLSGGEKSRLNLAKFLIHPPNCLFLDEPTTHLDVDAVDALIRALEHYEGTLVFISHDIHFVRSVANVVYEVSASAPGQDGKGAMVRKFFGDFDYYLEKRDQGLTDLKPKKPKQGEEKARLQMERDRARQEEKQKKEEERRRKAHNMSVGNEIQKLKKEKQELELESYAKARALSDPRTYANQAKARDYGQRLKEIELRCRQIDAEVAGLEKKLE
ncbi:MAG: ABC-F family ATP-binding cassette domain-containing protein [Candidatus Omnitrophica bacterium]|nr:ABC-F family ATP-binding cassette domain-containing protein [Candidatus Omnitrophota bacterium]MDD5138489.1 ABC-F family ATP-binding cassette domain-containing protein [Candidatus Omnitrophota bacterium]